MGTILVVDDGDDVRQLLKIVLEQRGYTVLVAENGKSALNVIQQRKPDLILLDLMMPIMNGEEFLKIKNNDPSLTTIPVVVITAAGHIVSVPSTQGFLRKPFDLSAVYNLVERYCH